MWHDDMDLTCGPHMSDPPQCVVGRHDPMLSTRGGSPTNCSQPRRVCGVRDGATCGQPRPHGARARLPTALAAATPKDGQERRGREKKEEEKMGPMCQRQ